APVDAILRDPLAPSARRRTRASLPGMRFFDWHNPAWRRRLWTLVSVLAVVAFVAHPELRLLLPVIDAIGIDVFVGLLGIQIVSLLDERLRPVAALAGMPLLPWLLSVDRGVSSVPVLRGVREFISYGV